MATTSLNTISKQPSTVIYDPEEDVHADGDDTTSLTARGVNLLTIQGVDDLGAAETVVIQTKIDATDAWQTVKSMENDDSGLVDGGIVYFANGINFLQIVVTTVEDPNPVRASVQ